MGAEGAESGASGGVDGVGVVASEVIKEGRGADTRGGIGGATENGGGVEGAQKAGVDVALSQQRRKAPSGTIVRKAGRAPFAEWAGGAVFPGDKAGATAKGACFAWLGCCGALLAVAALWAQAVAVGASEARHVPQCAGRAFCGCRGVSHAVVAKRARLRGEAAGGREVPRRHGQRVHGPRPRAGEASRARADADLAGLVHRVAAVPVEAGTARRHDQRAVETALWDVGNKVAKVDVGALLDGALGRFCGRAVASSRAAQLLNAQDGAWEVATEWRREDVDGAADVMHIVGFVAIQARVLQGEAALVPQPSSLHDKRVWV